MKKKDYNLYHLTCFFFSDYDSWGWVINKRQAGVSGLQWEVEVTLKTALPETPDTPQHPRPHYVVFNAHTRLVTTDRYSFIHSFIFKSFIHSLIC